MKFQPFSVRNSLFILVIVALAGVRASAQTKPDSSTTAQSAAIPARITQAVDEARMVQLKGNVHPLARAEFDQGVVADSTPASRMLLVLKRSSEQEAALQQLMQEQNTKNSPNYHRWLTPDEFGKRFGVADGDIQTITQWLTTQGFQGVKAGPGHMFVEFTGTIGAIRSAFHTDMHHFFVNGEPHLANVTDPEIPAALEPVIAGVASLHNFRKQPFMHYAHPAIPVKAAGGVKPNFTFGAGQFAVGPADFAKIYNLPSGLDGTNQSIAIVQRSNINLSDVQDFRNGFGLPVNDPVVILNGPDPGPTSDAEGEADLDVEWSGAIAPKAKILLVISASPFTTLTDGVDLSSLYIIENNLAGVMSVSFGSCEAFGGNQAQNALWQQAAAQGITVAVSSGDSGSAGCDPDPNAANPNVANHGLAVSGTASTPFNVAVGGTDFDYSGSAATNFWGAANSGTGHESAISYIPEMTWNDTCARTATNGTVTGLCASANSSGLDLEAGSGGESAVYLKPPWQQLTITGIPTANVRSLPDVSLFAAVNSISNNFYVFCQADSQNQGGQPCVLSGPSLNFSGVGGTSASAVMFAGITALINQSEANAGRSNRQGNANYVLYALAAAENANFGSCNSSTGPSITSNTNCVFNDVTKGNISVACAGKSLNCSSQTTGTNGILVDPAHPTNPGWATSTGYDLATGLGSLNVTNLVNKWGTAAGNFAASGTTLAVTSPANLNTIQHGQAVAFHVTVAHGTGGSGTPTGIAALTTDKDPDPNASTDAPGTTTATKLGLGSVTLTAGAGSSTTNLLPGGSYNLLAHYPGDGTFAASDSNLIPVIVAPEASATQVALMTPGGTATNVPYGSPYILRIDVVGNTSGSCFNSTATSVIPCPTGTIALTDNNNPLNDFLNTNTGVFSNSSTTGNEGFIEDTLVQLTGGAHTIKAAYSGDTSFSGSTGSVALMITPAVTATVLTGPTTVAAGTNVTITATVSSQSNSSVGATGTMDFFSGGAPIRRLVSVTPTGATSTTGAGGTATLTTSFASPGTQTITAIYSGDTNYAGSNALGITITVTSSGSFTVTGGSGTIPATPGTTPDTVTIPVTVTPSGGFTGTVAITCATAGTSSGFLPLGASCNALNIPVNGGNAVQGTLTVSLTAPSPTLSAAAAPAERKLYTAGLIPSNGGKGWWMVSAGTGLAAMFLLFLPGRKRYRAALGLGLVCVLSFTLGCGGGYGGGGGGGPVATTTTLAVAPATKNPTQATITVTPYSGAAPQGSATLADLTSTQSSTVTINNGIGLVNLALAGTGTHTLQATYAGTATDKTSHSGTLNVTVTGGPQSVAITGTSGSTTASGTINVSIN